jgi:hypothetical protein
MQDQTYQKTVTLKEDSNLEWEIAMAAADQADDDASFQSHSIIK